MARASCCRNRRFRRCRSHSRFRKLEIAVERPPPVPGGFPVHVRILQLVAAAAERRYLGQVADLPPFLHPDQVLEDWHCGGAVRSESDLAAGVSFALLLQHQNSSFPGAVEHVLVAAD